MERVRRKWSQAELGHRVGKSQATIKNLESGQARKAVPSELLENLDREFEWPRGTLEEKLRADGPVSPEPDYRIEPSAPGDIVALIRSVVFDAVVSAAPDTPISRVREIEERALEAAERAGFGTPRRRLSTHTEDDPAA